MIRLFALLSFSLKVIFYYFFCIIETFLREWFRLFALLSFSLKVIFYYFCMYNRDIFKGMFYIHCFLSTEHEFSTKSCLYYYRKLSVSRSQVALRLNFLFEFLKLFNFTFALFFCLFLFQVFSKVKVTSRILKQVNYQIVSVFRFSLPGIFRLIFTSKLLWVIKTGWFRGYFSDFPFSAVSFP